MPINPMVMRLPGAFRPNTVEGTMVGSASVALARAALLRNSRRGKEWSFIVSTLARMAGWKDICQTHRQHRDKETGCRAGQKVGSSLFGVMVGAASPAARSHLRSPTGASP